MIRRYVDERVTIIMLTNVDDGGTGVDALSGHIADVRTRCHIHSLAPKAGGSPARVAQVKAVLTSIGNGVEHRHRRRATPGDCRRSGARCAETSQLTTGVAGRRDAPGAHFNADPPWPLISRYRALTADGARYFTIRQRATIPSSV